MILTVRAHGVRPHPCHRGCHLRQRQAKRADAVRPYAGRNPLYGRTACALTFAIVDVIYASAKRADAVRPYTGKHFPHGVRPFPHHMKTRAGMVR